MGVFDPFTDGVWCVDFEFHAPAGERPEPICLVAHEFRSGRTVRLEWNELRFRSGPPFPIGPNALFVAYYASAELGCFKVLGWPMPARVLDLYVEFKRLTSGVTVPCGRGLLGALAYYGIGGIGIVEKDEMRELAMRGGPFSAEERRALVEYCETDVVALAKLLPAMADDIDLPRALLRGRYMVAASRMEWAGVPIDTPALTRLRNHWSDIQGELVAKIDADFGVYDGKTFKTDRFVNYLVRRGIPWPVLDSGSVALDDDTFRQMSKAYPELSPLRELRHSLAELRLESLAVGSDGRNRCLLSAFGSKTGRNQPSNSKFIFGPSVWLRCLIKPGPGQALAYIDYEQQEFGIAAALSGDTAMMAAYESGDPYLAFAKQAGAVPSGATAESHSIERALFKACVLAVQYGMGAKSLALRIGQPEIVARNLLQQHRQTYPVFWRWSRAAVDHAMLRGKLHTVFGWNVRVGDEANPRSLANFPCQANGAEMLRLACCLATERGVVVCAPVHDAVLIEAPTEAIDDAIVAMQQAMTEAGELVLNGFRLRCKPEMIVRSPDRYMDEKRGRKMWETVMGILAGFGGA